MSGNEWPTRAAHPTYASYKLAMETYREARAMENEARAQPFGPAELRAWRDQFGYSQSQLATKLGIAARTVARWEAGDADLPPYLRLALEALEARAKERREP